MFLFFEGFRMTQKMLVFLCNNKLLFLLFFSLSLLYICFSLIIDAYKLNVLHNIRLKQKRPLEELELELELKVKLLLYLLQLVLK